MTYIEVAMMSFRRGLHDGRCLHRIHSRVKARNVTLGVVGKSAERPSHDFVSEFVRVTVVDMDLVTSPMSGTPSLAENSIPRATADSSVRRSQESGTALLDQ